MAIIKNEIVISASVDRIWSTLTDLELLDRYDPTVKKSTSLSNEKTGIGTARRVDMLDGKNWFEEKIAVFKPHEALTYQLTNCTFPISKLTHSYSFEKVGNRTKVTQVMEYTVKFGLLGKLLDSLLVRKRSDDGVKKFFSGLKSYLEKQN